MDGSRAVESPIRLLPVAGPAALAAVLGILGWSGGGVASGPTGGGSEAMGDYGKLPLSFTRNEGQTDRRGLG